MDYKREDLALDALMAASLRAVEFKKEITEDEAYEYCTNQPELSLEDKAAIDSLGQDVFSILPQKLESRKEQAVFNEVYEEELFMAMNRKNSDDGISEETRKEIERKREAIQKKLEDKRKKKIDGNNDPESR